MSNRKYGNYRDPALQKRILGLVDASQWNGLTVSDLRQCFDPNSEAHHGDVSGALSMLHSDNRIARLTEKRAGCKVYVHPDYLDGRSAEAQGRGGPTREEIAFNASLVGLLEYWLQVDTEGARFSTTKTKAERNLRLFFKELLALWRERP